MGYSKIRTVRHVPKLAAAAAAALILAACGSTSTPGTSPPPANVGGSLVFGAISTFTGPIASFGPEMMAGCYTATKLIDQAKGILGRKAICLPINTNGDPADAVAAVSQALATDNLSGVLGPGGTATATTPLLTTAKMTMLADTGDSAYNYTKDPYFWRITPPDSAGGLALAAWGYDHGCRVGAAVFNNTTTAQTSVPTLLSGFKRLGGRMAVKLQLVPDSSTYESEVLRVVAAHPQCLFTEADPQTDATFLSEFKQFNHGKLIPIIGTEPTITSTWQDAVGKAIGTTALANFYVGMEPYTPPAGRAWEIYHQALLADSAQVPSPVQWSADPYSMTDYDGINIMALAMLEAKSILPAKYNPYILNVTQPGPGKIPVYSFAQGKSLIIRGKAIRYIGAGGPVDFNQYHNYGGAFSAMGYTLSGKSSLVGLVSAAQITKLSS